MNITRENANITLSVLHSYQVALDCHTVTVLWHSITLVTLLNTQFMNSMKLVISLHSLYWSIHTKDESKRGTAFAFIFGVN